MSERSSNNRRLARNTLLLYGRMLVCMFISIYTSRLVLAALGEEDYGVYNVVGGVVAMFSMLSGSLSSAISRFQAFELGKSDNERLKNAFSASFLIQILMSVIIFVLVEAIAVWFLNTRMTIPPGRITAANVVLQCSLVAFISSLLIVPYSASVVAHEDMGIFAVISIVEVVFKLVIALFLSYAAYKGDKLIFYAVALVACTLTLQAIYRIYCHKRYVECSFSKPKDRSVFKEILSFAGWNFLGSAAGLFNNQGINIVLNMLFGPAVNAARGLSMTVSGIVSNFVNSFTTAIHPQVVKSYAAGEGERTLFLVARGTKFCFFVMLLLALPIILEADFLVDLWLVDVPDHTVNFVRLVMCVSLIDVLSIILGMGQNATGKIRTYQIISSTLLLSGFGLSCLLLKLLRIPEVTYAVAAAVSIMVMILRLIFAHNYLHLPVKDFIFKVYARLGVVTVSSAVIPVVLHFVIRAELAEFFVVCFSSLFCTSFAVLFVGCDSSEREFIFSYLKNFITKAKS